MGTSNYNVILDVIKHWWLILIAGILLFVTGAWIIISPFQSFFDLTIAIALGIMISGISELIFSFKNRRSIRGWVWMFLAGIIDFFIGFCLFNFSLVTMVMLPLIFSTWILFRGIIATGYALFIRSYGIKNWRWLASIALTIILLALLILLYPFYGIKTLMSYTGVGFILSGLFRVYLSLKFKKIKELTQV